MDIAYLTHGIAGKMILGRIKIISANKVIRMLHGTQKIIEMNSYKAYVLVSLRCHNRVP